jgi:hypothetical protein
LVVVVDREREDEPDRGSCELVELEHFRDGIEGAKDFPGDGQVEKLGEGS